MGKRSGSWVAIFRLHFNLLSGMLALLAFICLFLRALFPFWLSILLRLQSASALLFFKVDIEWIVYEFICRQSAFDQNMVMKCSSESKGDIQGTYEGRCVGERSITFKL